MCTGEIVSRLGSGDAPLWVEYPPWQPPIAEMQGPAFAGREIDEGELRRVGADEPPAPPDPAQVIERGMVAREHQVIAVVDGQAERSVVIGATPPPRLVRGFMDDDAPAGGRKPHGGGEAGEPGADHMDCPGAVHSQP